MSIFVASNGAAMALPATAGLARGNAGMPKSTPYRAEAHKYRGS